MLQRRSGLTQHHSGARTQPCVDQRNRLARGCIGGQPAAGPAWSLRSADVRLPQRVASLVPRQASCGTHASALRRGGDRSGRARQPPTTTTAAAAADTMVAPQAAAKQPTKHTDVLIVGGGPAGLAAAIMLASHGCSVTVAERNAQVTYADPDRSYVYAIDGRGRQFTDKYGLSARLAAASVDALDVTVTRVQPDGSAVSNRQVIKDERRLVYWLPRTSFMALLEDEAASGPMAPRITVLRNTEAAAITRSVDGQLSVALRSTADGGSESVYAPALVVGCDGMHSVVRGTLQAWAANEDAHPASTPAAGSNTHHAPALAPAAGAAAAAASSRFGMVHAPSLSTNLRFKVLQLPPNPAMADGTVLHNPSFSLLVGQKAPLIGGPPLRLGLLPIKDRAAGRTANLITLPDHPVWGVSDGETLYSVFEQAFPQANWRQLVPADVMAKFAASRGGQFPAPQYSNGLAVALGRGAGGSGGVPRNGGGGGGGSGGGGSKVAAGAPLKGSGVVLIGDAAHCFPPDLGQGVNSALEDVCVLEKELFGAAAGDLGAALPAFEARRMPDSAALVKLVQIGFPLQYNQYPLLRTLWNIRFMAQVLAHKVLPALVSPPLFLMIQDPAQSYSSVLAATERSRAMLAVLAAALVAALAWLVRAAAAHFAGAGAVAA